MYDTKEEMQALGFPANADFEKVMNSPDKHPFLSLSFEQSCAFWQANPRVPKVPDTPSEYTIKTTLHGGHETEVRVYKPAKPPSSSSSSKTPLVVLIHGGGFCVGHWSHMGGHARALTHLLGVTAVSIAYRLAPGHKFPQAPRDVWETLSWLTSNAGLQAIGGDVDPAQGLVVGGISAGGNLATVTAQKSALLTAQKASDKLPYPVKGVWAAIPVYYELETVPDKYRALWTAREQNANARTIDANTLEFVRGLYEQVVESPEYCPGYGVPDAAATMPPTYIQVAGQDPLRDDGIIYEKVLRDYGVKTKLDAYPGVPHGFAEMTEIPLTWKSKVDVIKGFSWLLNRVDVPSDEECLEACKIANQTASH